MEFQNPNELKQIRKNEGFRKEFDIWDLTHWEQAFEEVHIEERVDHNELNQKAPDLEIIREFCKKVVEQIKTNFIKELQNEAISDDDINSLKEKNCCTPRFTIASKEEAKQMLKEIGLRARLFDDELVVNFQLPKRLAKFCYEKFEADESSITQPEVKWNEIYEEIMEIVWELRDGYSDNQDLIFRRINFSGDHDPDNYYYVWSVQQR